MGTFIPENGFCHLLNNTFVFDLEYIGTSSNLNDCYIWDIGVIHIASGSNFSIIIDPDIRPLPKPFSPEFLNVTEDFLHKNLALTFKSAWACLIKWIKSFNIQGPIVWISHNNFKGDKQMLEIDTKRNNIVLPYNWFFFDSLIYFRKIIPKLPSYALSDLHLHFFNVAPYNSHRALSDAYSLLNILKITDIMKISGFIYPSYSTSLQVIKWLGPASEEKLIRGGIRSVEELVINIMKRYSLICMTGCTPEFKQCVRDYFITDYNIKSGNAISIASSVITNWLPGV
jgi:DNA polymerase III epsilon subunit-like protein